jgi:hypothetical protein
MSAQNVAVNSAAMNAPGAAPGEGSQPTTAAGSPTAGLPKTVPAASLTPMSPPADSKTNDGAAKPAIELQIHVSKATWLSVQADGKAAAAETLRDSATKTVVAQEKVVLTTGNSVDVTCNGKPLGILGADNRRSQIRITADCKVN